MFEFKHPKYYKNLRKLARLRNRDQAISLQASTEDAGRTPGTGPKIQLKKLVDKLTSNQAHKPSSSQAGGGRVGPKVTSLQAGAQASSGSRTNKRWI